MGFFLPVLSPTPTTHLSPYVEVLFYLRNCIKICKLLVEVIFDPLSSTVEFFPLSLLLLMFFFVAAVIFLMSWKNFELLMSVFFFFWVTAKQKSRLPGGGNRCGKCAETKEVLSFVNAVYCRVFFFFVALSFFLFFLWLLCWKRKKNEEELLLGCFFFFFVRNLD